MIAALAALAVAFAVVAPGGLARADDKPADDTVEKARPARWWLEIYAHTMQEQAFIGWMDVTTGSQTWRHTMQEKRVNAMWDLWVRSVWNPFDSHSDTRR